MLEFGINATRLLLAVAFNAFGLALLLTVAWYLPQFLGVLISQGLPAS